MKKLIIFDCDGTLVDSEHIASYVFPRIFSAMGIHMTSDYFICNFVGTSTDSEFVQNEMKKLPPNAMAIANQKFEEELRANLKAIPGISDLLDKIEHSVCVASNSSLPYLKMALEKTSLAKYFGENVYSAKEIKKPKPAPDLFLHAAREFKINPSDCLVIEDSVSGIRAAKNAKMKVVGFMGGLHFNDVVKNKLHAEKADFYFSNTLELSDFILNWK
jgi:HAD superfamily hydrolase (TIGR01509 family)